MFLLIIALILLFYYYSTRNHNYWAKRNVKHYTPIPLFGNIFRILIGRMSITEMTKEIYDMFPEEQVVGYYKGVTPVLLIRDPNLAKQIMVTDFSSFYKRGYGRNVQKEPELDNVLHGDGDSWKLIRQRLNCAFTSAKIKKMLPLLKQCTNKLDHFVGDMSEQEECEVVNIMQRYTMDFIAACVYGIESDTMTKENSLFVALGKIIFARPLFNFIKMAAWELFPEVREKITIGDPRVHEIIYDLLHEIRKIRNFKPSGRNDFIDLLLEMEAMKQIKGESIEKTNADGSPVPIQIDIELRHIMANMFVFFAAGYDTSTTSTSVTLHQLALHPEIQRDIQKELDEVFAKYNNELIYDAIAEMRLLRMAYMESLRIFPPGGTIFRECTEKFHFSQLGITIDPGVKIIIPVQAYHVDPQYFKNPEKFQPDRFESSQLLNNTSYPYFPFGEGHRKCIGERLAYVQTLAGLATILHKFTVEPGPNTKQELQLDHKKNTVQGLAGGLYLKIKRR